jgi:hypothetical protein
LLFLAVTISLFATNMAISGDWNYLGGGVNRRTCYSDFPFQKDTSTFEACDEQVRDGARRDSILDRPVFLTNLTHNLYWFFVGRFAGLVPYFFPAVFALLAFLASPRGRPAWQYLVLGTALGQILIFIISVPYTWNGDASSVGNRYFMGAYSSFLFLLPPMTRPVLALVPWAIGGLFTAQLVLNPFVTLSKPADHSKGRPFRWLPPELTLFYAWPINTQLNRVRISVGDPTPERRDSGFQMYFLDDNAYLDGEKTFWVRGHSDAEFLIRADRPMKKLILSFSAGREPVTSIARLGSRSQRVALQPGEVQQVAFELDAGFPYQGHWRVWEGSVNADRGFVPLFHEPSSDTRFLGVRVTVTLVE